MNATITIPHELERKLAGLAAAQGKGVEQFTLEALERVAEMPSLRDLFADVREQIKASGTTEEELTTQFDSVVAEVRKGRRAAQTAQALAIVEELYGTIKGLDRETIIQIAEDEEICGY